MRGWPGARHEAQAPAHLSLKSRTDGGFVAKDGELYFGPFKLGDLPPLR
jgi:hypothetical protein